MEDKKSRIDKGTVKIAERDEIVLRWIAEQGGINLNHLAVLLTRNQEEGTVKSSIISQAGVKRVLRRWLKAGWVEYENPFRVAIHPGYIWLSHAGLQDFQLGFRYVDFKIGTLRHLDAVNQVRLWVESRPEFGGWTAERILRRDKGRLEHMPDAEIVYAGRQIAIEVEIQRKSHQRLSEIMDALQREYRSIWYFVNRESEAGVRFMAENRPIGIRHLDKILLHAPTPDLST
jgi:hypothetical protein